MKTERIVIPQMSIVTDHNLKEVNLVQLFEKPGQAVVAYSVGYVMENLTVYQGVVIERLIDETEGLPKEDK